MHSRHRAWILALVLGYHAAAGHGSTPPLAAPTRADIDAAVSKLRRDPNLPGERKIKSLRWTNGTSPTAPAESPAWLVGLFDYLGQTASLLIWVAGALGAGIASIWIYRVVRAHSPRTTIPPAAAA